MAEETNPVKFTGTTPVKFSDEELQSLQGLQEKYTEKQGLLGQLAVQRLLLDQQSEALTARTTEVEQEEERNLVTTLNEKYGPGQLDPTSGVFTPTSE